jgi:prolyl oligopeptidase
MKTYARMAASSTSGKPVLLRVDGEAGHGVTSTAETRNAELADRLAFVLWNTGDARFQPVTAARAVSAPALLPAAAVAPGTSR